MADRNRTELYKALSNLLGEDVSGAEYEETILQGGTVGKVLKIAGIAQGGFGVRPFCVVEKIQQKWSRYGDPASWRREYEIYKHQLPDRLSRDILLPRCLNLAEDGEATRVWMEFIGEERETGSWGWKNLA